MASWKVMQELFDRLAEMFDQDGKGRCVDRFNSGRIEEMREKEAENENESDTQGKAG